MLFGKLGLPELGIILLIVILLFGVGRISKISEEIGKSIRAFRKGISNEDEEKKPEENKDDTAGK